MPLVEYFYNKPHLRITASGSTELNMGSLLSTPNIGELRILSCIHSEDDVHGIITLLEAANPSEVSSICAYVIRVMEIVGRATPLLSPYQGPNRSKSTSTDRIMRAFMNFSKGSNGAILVQPFTLIAQYKTMHESISKMAVGKLVPLIIVPFHNNLLTGSANANSVREFNINLLKYATCTVGILVEGATFSLRFGCDLRSNSQFSYSIGVLFLGGEDDREALALAARMSNQPNVSLTITRIVMLSEEEMENDVEAQLDEKLFGHFKAKYEGNNACIKCKEMTVENSMQVIRAIRSLENSYDLIIVGRQRKSDRKFVGEMVNWTEYKELGVIGDVIASSDFCGGRVSLLVLQHHGAGGVPDETFHTADAATDGGKRGLSSFLRVSSKVENKALKV